MELLKSMAGVKMVHVPYKGTGQAVVDLISGKRISAAPDVPAVADTLPGFEAATWYGVLAPARVTSDIVQKLHAGNYAVLQLQLLGARARVHGDIGLEPRG